MLPFKGSWLQLGSKTAAIPLKFRSNNIKVPALEPLSTKLVVKKDKQKADLILGPTEKFAFRNFACDTCYRINPVANGRQCKIIGEAFVLVTFVHAVHPQ
jgi:hypothetical protein